MIYLALDIETTGLDPQRDRVVEIALVKGDTERPLRNDERDELHLIVRTTQPLTAWDPTCRDMHRRLIGVLYEGHPAPPGAVVVSEGLACALINDFVRNVFGDTPARLAGKNLAGFDLPFLRTMYARQLRHSTMFAHQHRILDVGSLAFDPERHGWIPDSAQVFREYLGPHTEVPHTALGDARAVCEIVSRTLSRPLPYARLQLALWPLLDDHLHAPAHLARTAQTDTEEQEA